jgi:hypothetical protein
VTATTPSVQFNLLTTSLDGTITAGNVYKADVQVSVVNRTVAGTDGLDPNYHSITISSFSGLPTGWTLTGTPYSSVTGCGTNQNVVFEMTITSPVLTVADSGLVISPVIYLAVQ